MRVLLEFVLAQICVVHVGVLEEAVEREIGSGGAERARAQWEFMAR